MLVFAGHPKASLVWHQYVYGEIFRKLALKVNYATRLINAKRYLEQNPCNFLFYKSASYKQIQDDWIGFHVYRDPRDMLISGYFSSKFSHPAEKHPKLQKQRAQLLKLPLDLGLMLEMDYLDEHFQEMFGWDLNDNRFLTISMEKLFSSEKNTFLFNQQVIKHLGWEGYITNNYLESLLEKYSFKNLTNRNKGDTDKTHHFRNGLPEDWKNYFTPEVKEEFKYRYGEILIEYNYEKSNDW